MYDIKTCKGQNKADLDTQILVSPWSAFLSSYKAEIHKHGYK